LSAFRAHRFNRMVVCDITPKKFDCQDQNKQNSSTVSLNPVQEEVSLVVQIMITKTISKNVATSH
jgi:hypothetical protein